MKNKLGRKTSRPQETRVRSANPAVLLVLVASLAALVACNRSDERPGAPRSYTSEQRTSGTDNPEALFDIRLPGNPLHVPEWVGKRGGSPFDVRQYVESILAAGVDEPAEQWYLNGMSQVSTQMAKLVPGEIGKQRQTQSNHLEGVLQTLLHSPTGDTAPVDEKDWDIHGAQFVLDLSRPAILAVDNAQNSRGIVFAGEFDWNRGLPHLQAARVLGRIFAVEIRLAADQGDFSQVLTTVRRSLRLAKDLRGAGGEIFHLVAISIESNTIDTLNQVFLTKNHWTAAEYGALLELIDEHSIRLAHQMDDIAKRSYLLCANALWGLEQGRISPGDLDLGEISGPFKKAINYSLEWDGLNEFYSWLLNEYAEQSYSRVIDSNLFEKRMDEIRKKMPTPGNVDNDALLIDGKLSQSVIVPMLLPALHQMRDACARIEVRIAALGLQLRIRIHQRVHGAPPTSLQDLVISTGLPDIPNDPYSEGKLRYRLKDGSILIYSVGIDQVDQNGEKDWNFGTQPGDFIRSMPLH